MSKIWTTVKSLKNYAPAGRLRRRLSVDVNLPATPTKKKGGRLAAKPLLDIIYENGSDNESSVSTPVKQTRRTGKNAESSVEIIAPAGRLRRRLSVDVNSPATPTKKKGGRLAAKPLLDIIYENGSDNESSVSTPVKQTRRTGKNAESSVEIIAPAGRLRRRLSVEDIENVNSPATPTKKKGGRLAAKPLLDIIYENAPAGRLRRRLSVDVNSPATPTKKKGGRLAAKPLLDIVYENAPAGILRRRLSVDVNSPATPTKKKGGRLAAKPLLDIVYENAPAGRLRRRLSVDVNLPATPTKKKGGRLAAKPLLDIIYENDENVASDILQSDVPQSTSHKKEKKNKKIKYSESEETREDSTKHTKKNKKRIERDDDIEEIQDAKVLKENLQDNVHVPRLPSKLLQKLEDKSKSSNPSKKQKTVSTTNFIVEEGRRRKNKPSNYLEESVYLDADSPDKTKVVGKIKKPKVLPFVPTASTSSYGFTSNSKVNILPTETIFVAQSSNVANFKNDYLYGNNIKRMGTYELYKKHRTLKLSKF